MKTASLIAVLLIGICLTGCENTALIDCQQEKETLTSQLNQANTTIAEKDTQIKALKAKNIDDQTKAMESITIMMNKQAEKDNLRKQKLAESAKLIKNLEVKVAKIEADLQNYKGLYENMKKALQTVEKEKQALTNKIKDIQKTITGS